MLGKMRSDWCCWSVNTLSWWLVSTFGSCMVFAVYLAALVLELLYLLSLTVFLCKPWFTSTMNLCLLKPKPQVHTINARQNKTWQSPLFCCCFLSDIFSICAVSIKRLFQGWSMETDYLLDISLWGVLVLEGETKCDTLLSGLCAALQKLN